MAITADIVVLCKALLVHFVLRLSSDKSLLKSIECHATVRDSQITQFNK